MWQHSVWHIMSYGKHCDRDICHKIHTFHVSSIFIFWSNFFLHKFKLLKREKYSLVKRLGECVHVKFGRKRRDYQFMLTLGILLCWYFTHTHTHIFKCVRQFCCRSSLWFWCDFLFFFLFFLFCCCCLLLLYSWSVISHFFPSLRIIVVRTKALCINNMVCCCAALCCCQWKRSSSLFPRYCYLFHGAWTRVWRSENSCF